MRWTGGEGVVGLARATAYYAAYFATAYFTTAYLATAYYAAYFASAILLSYTCLWRIYSSVSSSAAASTGVEVEGSWHGVAAGFAGTGIGEGYCCTVAILTCNAFITLVHLDAPSSSSTKRRRFFWVSIDSPRDATFVARSSLLSLFIEPRAVATCLLTSATFFYRSWKEAEDILPFGGSS